MQYEKRIKEQEGVTTFNVWQDEVGSTKEVMENESKRKNRCV